MSETRAELVERMLATARLEERIEAKEYEGSLLEFAGYVWPVVEPAIPFVRGWALEAIADHLEAVTYGHIRRLLINVPPGFSKSLMTDVFWPAWEWGPRNMPWTRYVCASYSNHLTERDNLRCRNIVVNPRYRRLWGSRFGISNEQFTKIKFANDQTGWKLATSVGGIGVGERGDRFIIDDGNNTMEMESEVTRATTNMWFTEVVPDRLNNQKTSAIVVIQQRLHEDDISGVALSREMGYTHLMIPMYHDVARHCVTVLGIDEEGQEVYWEDPREEDGELAWPERFDAEVCKDLERDKGPYAWVGQYQQTPEPRGGAIIKRDYWQLWKRDRFPQFEYILASLDTAYTTKQENDPSALTIWGVFREDQEGAVPGEADAATVKLYDASLPPKIMLIYAWQDRLEFNDLCNKVIELCTIDPADKNPFRYPVDRIIVEAKAAGYSLTQELYRLIGGRGKLGLDLIDPAKGKWTPDKVARVHSIQHLFADKMIYAPERAYSDMVINQCAIFPKGSHDDLVDTVSQALRYLRDAGFALRREEYAVSTSEEMSYRGRRSAQPLYPI
jgi:predicted phage terminase large subunit-like protein